MDCTAIPAADDSAPALRKAAPENWSAIVAELVEQHGMSQPQIAEFCGCGQSSISDLVRGVTKDPRHRIGVNLLALLKAKRQQAPHEAAAAPAPGAGAGETQAVGG